MHSLSEQIEVHLLNAQGWVSVAELCQKFDLNQRDLRAHGDEPGLCDAFAVTSTRQGESGYIHHRFLPTADWLPIKHRLRRHAIAELRKAQRWAKARARLLIEGAQMDNHQLQLL